MEKEMSIEEMKNVVAFATLLPALLDVIDEIKSKLEKLSDDFSEMKSKFNDNTKAIIEYKKQVDSLVDSIPSKEDIEDILTKHYKENNESRMANSNNRIDNKNENSAKAKTIKKKDDNEEEITRISLSFIKDMGGNKRKIISIPSLKQKYSCSDKIAKGVIEYFRKKGMYDEEMHAVNLRK